MSAEHFHQHLVSSPADLTDIQFRAIYQYPRDKDGQLVPPKGLDERSLKKQAKVPTSMEEELRQIGPLMEILKQRDPKKAEEMDQQVRDRWKTGRRVPHGDSKS